MASFVQTAAQPSPQVQSMLSGISKKGLKSVAKYKRFIKSDECAICFSEITSGRNFGYPASDAWVFHVGNSIWNYQVRAVRQEVFCDVQKMDWVGTDLRNWLSKSTEKKPATTEVFIWTLYRESNERLKPLKSPTRGVW